MQTHNIAPSQLECSLAFAPAQIPFRASTDGGRDSSITLPESVRRRSTATSIDVTTAAATDADKDDSTDTAAGAGADASDTKR